MPNTRKKYHDKKHKTQRKTRATAARAATAATMEQMKQNRRRNKMVRNIRMGRVRQSGGGLISQLIGSKPWTPDSIGRNYFALSPKGVGTGLVPKFDDGRSLGNARYPTQLGPQLAKLGQAGGRRSRKNIKGGGVLDGATYLVNNLNAKLGGTSPPTNPDPHVQPISKTSCSV